MIPDDFPDIVPSDPAYLPRPQEKYGSIAEATMEPEGPKAPELPTMQLRCQLDICNTGTSHCLHCFQCVFGETQGI